MSDTVTIPKKRYEELLRLELYAQALDEGGVDNWDWHGDACERYQELLKQHNLECDDD